MKPTVGRIVHYTSKHGDGVVSPAVVLRTRDSTVPGVIDRWGPAPDGTASGTPRPTGLVAEPPDDTTLDLLVHGPGGDYREYAVPQCPPPPIPVTGTGSPATPHPPSRTDASPPTADHPPPVPSHR